MQDSAPAMPSQSPAKRRSTSPFMALVRLFSSLRLAMVLLVLLAILTLLGTLAQQDLGLLDAQKKYFESWYLIEDFGPVPVPLPGGRLVMTLLTVNLLVGGLLRLRTGVRMAGIMITHIGMLILILSGAVKTWFAVDGHVTLFEGEESAHFQSFYDPELAISRVVDEGQVEEFTIPASAFDHATGAEPALLSDERLPFDIEISHYSSNSAALRKGPMFDVPVPVIGGLYLAPIPRDLKAENNAAGAYVTTIDKATGERTTDIAWGLSAPGFEAGPFTVHAAGGPWLVDIRKERYSMPFTLRLDDFQKRVHPRTNMPSWFSSDVTVEEAGAEREVQISMNKPLRDQGLVVFQASWGPEGAPPGTDLFSTFQVVRNPSDKWPMWSCFIIAFGMLLHFLVKLARHIGSELNRARA